jgi:hypothetical protein
MLRRQRRGRRRRRSETGASGVMGVMYCNVYGVELICELCCGIKECRLCEYCTQSPGSFTLQHRL